jgi:dTDP-4-dehydrorhamnose reductase
MKVFMTGANGLVGQHLSQLLLENDYTVIASGKGHDRLPFLHPHYHYTTLDFTDAAACRTVLEQWQPEVVVHGGAISKPDVCEQDPPLCTQVNVTGTDNLLQACMQVLPQAQFIFLSTDFIFSGEAGPYAEDDAPGPVNVYGHSKLAAEALVKKAALHGCILRTQLVYGNALQEKRQHFISMVRTHLEKGEGMNVFKDQWRTPTYIGDLVQAIEKAIAQKAGGVFHISGEGFYTPYDIALQTAALLQLDAALLQPVVAADFPQPARRPARTGFIIDKAKQQLGYQPLSFEEGLRKVLESW